MEAAQAPVLVDDHPSLPVSVLPDVISLDRGTQERWATPRPASLTAEPILEDAAVGLPPMNALQLALIRAGLERQDIALAKGPSQASAPDEAGEGA